MSDTPKIPLIEVHVAVAVNENGATECMIYDDCRVIEMQKYNVWKKAKLQDNHLWHIKIVKIKVPYPMSYEDLSDV